MKTSIRPVELRTGHKIMSSFVHTIITSCVFVRHYDAEEESPYVSLGANEPTEPVPIHVCLMGGEQLWPIQYGDTS